MATNKTSFLNMNDWVGTDPFRREEINDNFRKLDAKAKEHEDELVQKADKSEVDALATSLADKATYYILDNSVTPSSNDATSQVQNFFDGLDSNKLAIITINSQIKISHINVIGKKVWLIGTGGFLGINDSNDTIVSFSNCGILRIQGLIFDGSSLYLNGIKLDNCPNARILENTFKNIGNATIDNVAAVRLSIGTDGTVFESNTIDNIVATAVSRGIIISNFSDTTVTIKHILISHNKFSNIKPNTDADGVVFDMATTRGTKSQSTVRDNFFYNCYKRAIKVIASGVAIINNKVLKDVAGDTGYSALAFYGDDGFIHNNDCQTIGCVYGIGIDVFGKRVTITNNRLINDSAVSNTTADGIDLRPYTSTTLDDIIVLGNQVSNFRYGVRTQNSSNRINISKNILMNCNSNNIFVTTGNHDKYVIEGNITDDTSKNKTFVNINTSTQFINALIKDNVTQATWGVIGTNNIDPQHTSNLIVNNTLNNVRSAEYVFGKLIDYKTVAPTSGTYKVNDEVINTSKTEQGTVGSKYIIEKWVCTLAGTPGTWTPMRMLTGN